MYMLVLEEISFKSVDLGDLQLAVAHVKNLDR